MQKFDVFQPIKEVTRYTYNYKYTKLVSMCSI